MVFVSGLFMVQILLVVLARRRLRDTMPAGMAFLLFLVCCGGDWHCASSIFIYYCSKLSRVLWAAAGMFFLDAVWSAFYQKDLSGLAGFSCLLCSDTSSPSYFRFSCRSVTAFYNAVTFVESYSSRG